MAAGRYSCDTARNPRDIINLKVAFGKQNDFAMNGGDVTVYGFQGNFRAVGTSG